MWQSTSHLLGWLHPTPRLAQVITTGATPEQASVLFSGPQFLIALLAGVVMAFGFQLLLTNLSIAFAMSPGGAAVATADVDDSSNFNQSLKKIEAKIGLWILLTVSFALFAACFLAVKLSLISSPALGAIIGVVVWSTYFSLLLWLGSKSMGSVLGALFSTVTSSLQGLLGGATTALSGSIARKQAVSTAEEITAAVRRELTSGIDSSAIQSTLQNAIAKAVPSQLNLEDVGKQFEQILQSSNLKEIADGDLLRGIDRNTLFNLIGNSVNLDKADLDRITDQLEQVWQRFQQDKPLAGIQDELSQFLKSASPTEIQDQLFDRLQQFVQVVQANSSSQSSLGDRVANLAFDSLKAVVTGRVDLSQVDSEKILGQVQQFFDQAKSQTQHIGSAIASATSTQPTILEDVEHYLLDSRPWEFHRETLPDEFRQIIYDPNADPSLVRQQLEQMAPTYFLDRLMQRGDLSADRIEDLAQLMQTVRGQVLEIVQQAEARERYEFLRDRVESYLRSIKTNPLNEEELQRELSLLLDDPDAGLEELQTRFQQFDQDALVNLLSEPDEQLDQERLQQISTQFNTVRDRILSTSQEVQAQAQARATELRQKVEDYLRQTQRDDLIPENIQRDIQNLLSDPETGRSILQARFSRFSQDILDRDRLVDLLSQRQDLSPEEINQILDRVETAWNSVLEAPQQLAEQAKESYDQTVSAIANYLRQTNLDELNPEGIQRDLARLLDDPKTGVRAWRQRLSQVDRETLVKLLAQRDDLTEAQVNRAIDQVQTALGNIIRSPQRFAQRVQQQVGQQVGSFESKLSTYLRNTNKAELNPDAIQRDLKLLLTDPSLGATHWRDRLSQVDRSTLVALLAQRQDISEAEANEIIDQIESARDRLLEQFQQAQQQLQQQLQSVLDSIGDRLRQYLNSLQRPELNYDSIKQDFVMLFNDPQAGVEALRYRLGQFDRETLIALITSSGAISDSDAHRIADQIEAARDNVLYQTEKVQQEVQKQVTKLKHQAQQQTRETRQIAADAAWWIFGAGLTSLVASMTAGAIAVVGLSGLGF